MSDGKVIDLFGNGPTDDGVDSSAPQPREYLFHFKELPSGQKGPVPAYGYPAFNGHIYAVLDVAEDASTINFCCLAGDVLYVADSERVED